MTFSSPWTKKRDTMKRTFLTFLAALAALLIVSRSPALAEGPDATAFPGDPTEPWVITCDLIEHSESEDVYTATGNVKAERGKQSMTADRVVWKRAAGLMKADGNVKVNSGSDSVSGDFLDMDIEAKTGETRNALLFVGDKRLYIRAGALKKTGEATFSFSKGSVTACKGEKPDWQITASGVTLTLEGYGHARNTTLWMGGVPVLYSPYLFFPVKTKRATGLLAPQLGRSSRRGIFWEQPLFIVPADNWDVTLYENYMERRGNQVGAELRVVPDATSKIWLYGAYLSDRQVDYGEGDYGYVGDDYPRTNTERYWFAGMFNKSWAGGVKLKADLDYLSDQDYLREFKGGAMGFDAVNKALLRNFARSLDDYDSSVRDNRIFLHKSFRLTELSGGVLWRDDVVARIFDETDPTAQKVPYINFALGRTPVFKNSALPLVADFSALADNIHRKDMDKGVRLNLHPRLSLPFNLGRVFSVEPSAGLTHTSYFINSPQGGDDADSHASRQVGDFALDVSNRLHKDYADSFRHVIFTTLSYRLVDDVDQNDLPHFDATDRLAPENSVTLSVVNHLLSREDQGVIRPVCYFLLSETYDIREADEEDPALWAEPGEHRPFSPVTARLELAPLNNLSAYAEARFSPYEKAFTYAATGMGFTTPTGHRLFADYYKTRDASEYVSLSADIKASSAFTFYGRYQRDLFADARVETSFGLIYTSDCWSLDLGYLDEPGEQQYTIRINLRGLGGIGGSFNPFD